MTEETRPGYMSIDMIKQELVQAVRENTVDGKYKGPLEDLVALSDCNLYLGNEIIYDNRMRRVAPEFKRE